MEGLEAKDLRTKSLKTKGLRTKKKGLVATGYEPLFRARVQALTAYPSDVTKARPEFRNHREHGGKLFGLEAYGVRTFHRRIPCCGQIVEGCR